jgi:hypothetical protein
VLTASVKEAMNKPWEILIQAGIQGSEVVALIRADRGPTVKITENLSVHIVWM